MLTKSILTEAALTDLIGAAFLYNRKGVVASVLWYDVEGKLVQLGWCEALTEAPGLVVRIAAEELFLDPAPALPGMMGNEQAKTA